jgi:tRNA-2-methylthio-N6-dimethylallyladenosine synthase
VRHLLDLGFEEIELLGQTVNHWREPGAADGPRTRALDFADLLDAVAPLPGLRRLRFLTTYPRDFTQRMIDALARHQNLCDYLHLPVQSGSDRVLRRMGRGYDVASYLELIGRIRAARPSVALSTDLIVGFPGESDDDFERTLELVATVRFTALFPFRYSPRPGTAALKLLDDAVPVEIAEERLRRLNEFQNAIQAELNAVLVGATKEVIVTGAGKVPGRLFGRTSCHRIVHFDGGATPPSIGSFVDVRITRAMAHSLAGELATRSPRVAAMASAPQRTLLPVVA